MSGKEAWALHSLADELANYTSNPEEKWNRDEIRSIVHRLNECYFAYAYSVDSLTGGVIE